jgi:hypothetical protein
MRIQGKMLKKIIKEEISRSLTEVDDINLAVARSKATSVASDLDRDSGANIVPMVEFFADVLAGNKVVTANSNTPEENLYINQALTAFENLKGLEGDLTSFPPSTYPEEGIIKLQKMCLLQQDGDFGRQTLAAAVSGGRARLEPSAMANPVKRNRAARLIAMMMSHPGPEDDSERLSQVLSGVDFKSGAAPDTSLVGSKSASPAEKKYPKSLLLMAAENKELMHWIAQVMGMSPDETMDAVNKVQDDIPRTLPEWVDTLAELAQKSVKADPAEMEKLRAALEGVSGDYGTGYMDKSGLRPGSYSRADAEIPMNESRDLTSRLMARWIK